MNSPPKDVTSCLVSVGVMADRPVAEWTDGRRDGFADEVYLVSMAEDRAEPAGQPDDCHIPAVRDDCHFPAVRMDGLPADCLAKLRGGCRQGDLPADYNRAGGWGLEGGSCVGDNPSCRRIQDDCPTRWGVVGTRYWADDNPRASRPRGHDCSRCCDLPSSIPSHPSPRGGC